MDTCPRPAWRRDLEEEVAWRRAPRSAWRRDLEEEVEELLLDHNRSSSTSCSRVNILVSMQALS